MRLVFVSNDPKAAPGPASFSSFSVAYPNILGVKYEQPWFGGNYIEFVIRPVQDGGLATGSIVKCQLRVDGRGLYEFSASLGARMNAERNKRVEVNTLPVYTPPTNQNSGMNQSSAQVPNDLPPGYSV
ncbi:hypothetical protein FRC16_004054 [Serendipita sp. 398]|nr:hypothetical protein FRC16_004054 [Serendipita sp. 398]